MIKVNSPTRLPLSVIDEMVVIENLEIFKKNGFDFEIDESQPPTFKLKMTAFPFSKKTQFGINGKTFIINLFKIERCL
jgi:DNA mismatch repair protein PMS2